MSDAQPVEKQEEGDQAENQPLQEKKKEKSQFRLYRIYFREMGQIFTGFSRIVNLKKEELVMAQTDHGLEPARIKSAGIIMPDDFFSSPPNYHTIVRRATRDEISKYDNLLSREKNAFDLCQERIARLGLIMKLISVERFFNGSKIIFYFTAENRVDFRELVKGLVQEFRTRVEMRQIGVRHETKMVGGIGCCGRELCCSSFIGKFAPVSIKMAKEQDLPLNPAKISGNCNRLLCCLTHEHGTYKELRKGMPKVGRTISYDGSPCKVIQCNVLKGTITVIGEKLEGPKVLDRPEWEKAGLEPRQQQKQPGKQGRDKGRQPDREKKKSGDKPGKGRQQSAKQKDPDKRGRRPKARKSKQSGKQKKQ